MVLCFVAGTTSACEGTLGFLTNGTEGGDDSGSSRNPLATCDADALGEQPLRRLSSIQYENTLRALFGETLGPRVTQNSVFPETIIDQGFRGDAEANTVNTAESNAIEDNAERIAALVLEDPEPFLTELLPCDVSSPPQDQEISSCVDEFLDEFGMRAYRRPMTDEETAIVKGVFQTVMADQGATAGFASMLQLLVQSPALLYRVERGDGETDVGHLRLTSYEMASRLSYFLVDSMPDDELLAAAARDELRTADQVKQHAARLAETPAFMATMTRFVTDWLHLYELEGMPKDPEVFPQFSEEMRAGLLLETRALLEQVLTEGDGSLRTLLDTALLPINESTAPLYGVDVAGSDFRSVEVPNRRGLLSQASVMAVLSEADRTNPIHRGAVFVREVMCEDLPALPGNIDTQTALEDTSNLPTARERLAPLLESAGCSGCHRAFNPVGLAFESYDAIGAFRTQENGSPIDTSGTFDLGDGSISFSGPMDLLAAASESEKVQACFSRQVFRAMKGRREFTQDQCSLDGAARAFRESGGDLREAFLSLVETDAFLYRTVIRP